MFYGGTPRLFAAEDRATVGCTRCRWVSPELPALRVQLRFAACGQCGQEVDRYIVYAEWERRRARMWMLKRMGKWRSPLRSISKAG